MSTPTTLERMLEKPVLDSEKQADLVWTMHNGIDFDAARQKIEEAKIELKVDGNMLPKSWGIDETAYRDSSNPEAIAAHDDLLLANTKIINRLANRKVANTNGRYDKDDTFAWMLSAASAGLWSYSPGSEHKLVTHIVNSIKWYEQRAESEFFTMVRLPENVYSAILRIRRHEADTNTKLAKYHSKDPAMLDILEKTGLNHREFVNAMNTESRFWNYNSNDGDSKQSDFFDYDGQPENRKTTADLDNEIDPNVERQFEEELNSNALNGVIGNALNSLKKSRTKQMIERRYGFADGEVHNLEQIGKSFGVTKERARVVIEDGLKELRQNTQIIALHPSYYYEHSSRIPTPKSPEHLMQEDMKRRMEEGNTQATPGPIFDLKTGKTIEF